jgi:flavin reductase (DIM6/NTAB) family NADH-FMN oxidoreductase RutF
MFKTTQILDATCHPQARPTAMLSVQDNIMPLSKEPRLIKSKLIEEAYMIYECLVIDMLNYGDHDIFIAEVKCIHNKDDKEVLPTLFMGRGRYETISKLHT